MSKAATLAGSGDSVKQCTLLGNPGSPWSSSIQHHLQVADVPQGLVRSLMWGQAVSLLVALQLLGSLSSYPKLFFLLLNGSPKHHPLCHLSLLSPRQRCFILTKGVVPISLKHFTVILKVETADFQFLILILTMAFLSLKRIRFNLITVCKRMAVKYIYVLISST